MCFLQEILSQVKRVLATVVLQYRVMCQIRSNGRLIYFTECEPQTVVVMYACVAAVLTNRSCTAFYFHHLFNI